MRIKKILYILLLLFISFVPLILGLTFIYLIFGNFIEAFYRLIELKGRPSSTANAVSSLSYVVTILITLYGILATSIFSYLVWRVSKGSYTVSREIKNLEEIRDEENTREQALIVYYDLNRGFIYIRDLYISVVLNNNLPNPRRLHFSGDWIKNVASLRQGLSNGELNQIYHLYDKFLTLQSLLNDFDEQKELISMEVQNYIKEFSEEFFTDFIPLELLSEFQTSSAEDLLKIDLYVILQKIYLLTFNKGQITQEKKENNSEIYYCDKLPFYKIEEGEKFNGKGTLYNSKGQEKARGEFFNSLFATGNVYGYFDLLEKQYKVEYQTSSSKREIVKSEIKDLNGKGDKKYFYKGQYSQNNLINGITTLFHSEGSIKYRGEIINGEKNGKGTSYSEKGEKTFEGVYKENKRHKGILFENNVVKFEGLFKNGQPWEGKVKNYNFRWEYISEFTGEIKNGKPYSGKGYRFKRNSYGDDLDTLLHEHYYEPVDHEDELREKIENELFNQRIRDEYTIWKDYIFTNWEEGEATEAEDDEENIIVYYNEKTHRK